MRFDRPRQRPQGDDAMLPLINIVFLLLIFFMIAGKLASSDPFEVEPPESATEELPRAEAPTLLLGSDGRLALEGVIIERDELAEQLQQLREEGRLERLRLRADARMDTPDVVSLMELLRSHGVERVNLITQTHGGVRS
ncbi:MAG TPA: biopolymer transporter ExbD [Kiloniellales bacterium]|jgi:biopolymer transport protein ExbD|nr:biopolymer transporter ExbD [Kiloniellales bacterium]